MIDPFLLLIIIPIVLFSLTVHEYSHAYAALILGDKTAKDMGRLTLNPLKHLDLLGTLAIILIGFGWAKPVPVIIQNLKKGRKSLYIVALAGPVSNFIIALIFAIIFHILGFEDTGLRTLQSNEIFIDLGKFIILMIYLNIGLGIFNLMPIPPLDGGNIIYSLLPDKVADKFNLIINKYIFILIIGVIFLTRTFPYVLLTPINFFLDLLIPNAILYLNG
tara:strand:+ start:639 stop:1295 length:657 start_codon:yes stop_codon:yes gene_type:complete